MNVETITRFDRKRFIPRGALERAPGRVPLLHILVLVDLLFILLHLIYIATPSLGDWRLSLAQDRGYAELFQYLKWFGLMCLMTLAAREKRQPLYIYWALLFALLLLDDAFFIHETAGNWLAKTLTLPTLGQADGIHLGEFLFAALSGLCLLTAFLFAYRRSSRGARDLSLSLMLFMLVLGLVAVVLDLAHELAGAGWLRSALTVLEDGGELLLVSGMTWYVWRWAQPVMGKAMMEKERAQTAVTAISLFGACLLLLGLIQFAAPALAGNDGYYHAKMGLLVRQHGLTPPPPQLPLTILNETEFYNHHLLYHGYLALFANVDPAVDGGLALTQRIKMAAVLLPALTFISIWWLLHSQRVRWTPLWIVALFALSADFLYRMSMPRVQAASLLALVWGLHWLLKRQYRWLLPLGFIYVWLYDAFPLLLALSGVYVVAVKLTEGKLPWRALAYPFIGILLGLVINPYFPQNLVFIGRHVWPKLWQFSTAAVGNEWHPYDSWMLLKQAGAPMAAALAALFWLKWQGRRMDARLLTLFIVTAVFGLMLFRARRFIEYFPPFALIFAALSVQPLPATGTQKRPLRMRWFMAGATLLLSTLAFITIQQARTAMRYSEPADRYQAAALWLKAYSQPGSRIFQLDWDDFPRLFFYDSDQVYTVGLDPTYMELYDPSLYTRWVQITQGEISHPGAMIRADFGADYVISDWEHEAFLAQAAEESTLEEIYRDKDAIIFSVLP